MVFQEGLGVADILPRPHKDEGHHALQRERRKRRGEDDGKVSLSQEWGVLGGGEAKATLQVQVRRRRLRRR